MLGISFYDGVATGTHIAADLGWVAIYHGIIQHILGYSGTRPYKGIFPQGSATNNSSIGTNAGTAFNQSIRIIRRSVSRIFAPGSPHIGKHHAWAAENIVFQSYSLIYADIVLYFYLVADLYPIANKNILAKVTSLTNFRTGGNMLKCQIRVPLPIFTLSST